MPTTTKTQEPERRQTGAKLDTELLRELKVLAARHDTTLGELLEQAMKEYLQRAKERETRKD